MPGARAETVQDPIFGLRFDPAKTRFEPAPDDITTRCPDLVNRRYGRRLWVFAKAVQDGTQTQIVGGLYVPRSGPAAGTAIADPRGALLQLSEAGCRLIGPASETFDYEEDTLGTPTLRLLAGDAAGRYARAFGGTGAFRQRLRSQHIDVTNPHSKTLNDAVMRPG